MSSSPAFSWARRMPGPNPSDIASAIFSRTATCSRDETDPSRMGGIPHARLTCCAAVKPGRPGTAEKRRDITLQAAARCVRSESISSAADAARPTKMRASSRCCWSWMPAWPMPTRTNSWMNSSDHQSSKGTLPPLLAAATPNSSVVDVTERMLCWPGGTSARNVGWDGEFRRLRRWVSSHRPDTPTGGFSSPSARLGSWRRMGTFGPSSSSTASRSKTPAKISFWGPWKINRTSP